MIDQGTEDICLLPVMQKMESDPESLARDFRHYLDYHMGRFLGCDDFYLYEAIAYVIRDRITADWRNAWHALKQPETRRAHYISLEFLIGRSLGNNLLNFDLQGATKEALNQFALNYESIEGQEPDAGLGNGGLGRLAACFLDSCATLNLPVIGYGLRYEYGMFHQRIEKGYQIEEPDHWLRQPHPWEIKRTEHIQTVEFGGRTEHFEDQNGKPHARWVETEKVLAIPYDIPIVGYRNHVVNTLRLWSASATDEFNLHEFNAGDYADAVASKNDAEKITMVLYPNDASENGKELRLRQQYFLCSATMKDVFRRWGDQPLEAFSASNFFQLNDTHPSISVAELMRVLMDEKRLDWDEAWEITTQCIAYTNHTLLPEALETWPVRMFEQLLPRLLEIIYEINVRFLTKVRKKWPGDVDRVRRMSIIDDHGEPRIRMAWLAIIGSSSVNGVAALHSELLKQGLFNDFYQLWPEKFNNKTNGVTPRRWIVESNPELSSLISETIGDGWQSRLDMLSRLKSFADNEHQAFQQRWREIRALNKQRLADMIAQKTGVIFNPESMFDVQVKRIHEYKRQLLNILHVIHLYLRIKNGDPDLKTNRCVLIGGKAAPGYERAKEIIKLINNVAKVINHDSDVGERLKVVFLPNYNVSKMMKICPAADLSEQISTAGKEASGTGNMKFMMNGAITIGTYDGANIEIMEAVGEENFFLFGLTAEEVHDLRHHYNPQHYIDHDSDLQAVLNLIESEHFNAFEPGIFDGILNALKSPDDPWMTLADFRSYINAQKEVEALWQDQESWTRKSILNTASSGIFSTDRTIEEYNRDIWKLEPMSY